MEELKEGWRLENLEENLEVILDYRGKTPQKSEKGRVTLSAKSVKMGYIDYSNIYYVSEETYSKFMTRGFPKKGDILLTTEAPLGCVAELKDDSVCLAQRLITLRGKKEKLNNKYLLYYLQSPRGQYELLSKATGTTVQGIKRTEFSKVKILMPSLEKQNKIVSILSSIDEKIELNRKINQNLEETAQTLFKRWFIDFEFPNEEGKPYKSSDGKLIESELGEIPEGWRVGKLGEIVEINPRENLKKLEKKIYIEMKCLSETSSIISEYYEREFTGTGTKFKNKDTLMARITPCLENRKIGYVNFLKDNDIGWGSTEFNILRSQNNIPREISYFIARSKKFLDYAISNMNGSSGRQRVSGKTLEEYNIVISSENIYKKFGKVSNTIMNQIENNRKEIEKLIELRDYLLPRLMSGEVNVSNLKISGISNSDLSFYLIQFFHLMKIKLKQFFLAILNHEF